MKLKIDSQNERIDMQHVVAYKSKDHICAIVFYFAAKEIVWDFGNNKQEYEEVLGYLDQHYSTNIILSKDVKSMLP